MAFLNMMLSKSNRINLALKKMNIFSFKDVLLHLPRRYEDLHLTHENCLKDKERIVFKGRLASDVSLKRFKNISISKFSFVTSLGNVFFIEAFNRPYLSKQLNRNDIYLLVGLYDSKKNKINLVSINKYDENNVSYIKPIYSLPSTMENYEYVALVERAFKNIPHNEFLNVVPDYFMKKYRLINKFDALELTHKPKDYNDIRQGLRVLKYEECLSFSLKNLLIREENSKLTYEEKVHFPIEKVEEFISSLPYKLTNDQRTSINEILSDMNQKKLMCRLLQGDVGSGKTLVSFVALYANYLRGDQGALLAPTDTLARQHFESAKKIFKNTNLRIALLLGSSSSTYRSEVRKALINNEIDLLVGTHILFSKDINYLSLGLAIIDEQHKFGVNQRKLLMDKGKHADLLLMSATPIPRTLALTLYGDMDVSTINELPIQNKDVKTIIVENDSNQIKEYIDKSLSENKRVFIVAPVIESKTENSVSVNDLYAHYLLQYPGKVALLHGKLDNDEKQFAISDFISNKCPILISTSVIEVGVDVKEANLMIIYNPTHFGLASLHQLRGRIGRDGTKSTCLLAVNKNDEDNAKLDILTKTNDGFLVAEEDLKMRGPGELNGVEQSGIPNFTFVNLVNDFRMFEVSRDDARLILKNHQHEDFKKVYHKVLNEIDDKDFSAC